MTEHLSPMQINDLLDGELTAAEAERARTHLAGCEPCRLEHGRLVGVVTGLRSLPVGARAPEGTWSAIEARIGRRTSDSVTGDSTVVRLPVERSARRRFAFSMPQVAAAAIVISILSAGTVWMTMSGRGVSPSPETVMAGSDEGPAARAASMGATRYEASILELEQIVEQGKDMLAPETLSTLDGALETIDKALAEVGRALASDPSSELLARLLVNHQRSKLRVLRKAASSVQART